MPLFIDDFSWGLLKVLLLICEIYSVEKWKLEKQNLMLKKYKKICKKFIFFN